MREPVLQSHLHKICYCKKQDCLDTRYESHLGLLLWVQQRVQRENIERNGGVSLHLCRNKTQQKTHN